MPVAYLPNHVVDAIRTINYFVEDQRSKKRSAAQPVQTWGWNDPTSLAKDRVRYYETNLNALRKVLNGHEVITSNGWVEGVEV